MTLAEAKQEFLDYLAERNKSLRTVQTYCFAINKFLAFCRTQGLTEESEPSEVTSALLRAYSRHLFHQRLSASGRKTYLVALTAWFKHLAAAEICQINTDSIELPKVVPLPPNPDERLPDMLSTEAPAFDSTEKELTWKRDRALLRVLFDTNARVSEVAALNRQSIDFEKGLAVIVGKGGKVRTVFFSAECMDAINAYLDQRDDDYDPLFIRHNPAAKQERIDRDGNVLRLSVRSIQIIVRKYAKRVGIKATPHSFRHYGGTEMVRSGADIRSVQEYLGHKSVSTTQIYTHVSPQRLMDEWKRFHPAGNR
ncbi:MAG TPA: tyrosine-type recombinase/integrase [Chloroflexota bacterium]|nr:tyrosine-type recombinase/integrase [Chloroflexota bacterium]